MALTITGATEANIARQLRAGYDRLNRITAWLVPERTPRRPADVLLAGQVNADLASIGQRSRSVMAEISACQATESAMGELAAALSQMAPLVRQVRTGIYSPEQIDEMEAEFRDLAEEVEGILARTGIDGESLLAAADSIVEADLDGAAELTLTDLPDDAVQIVDTALAAVSAERTYIGAHIRRLETQQTALDNQALRLEAFAERIDTANEAAAMADSVLAQVLTLYEAAVEMQAQVAVESAWRLLSPTTTT